MEVYQTMANTEEKKKKKINRKIKYDQMVEYIKKNAPDDLKWFEDISHTERYVKKKVKVIENGIWIQKPNAKGELEGCYKMVDDTDKKKKRIKNVLKAQNQFFKRYPDAFKE